MIYMFVTYAHRGASEYAPENTKSSFSLGFEMGANGVETDVRRTKDGVLVLFHDKTLERVACHSGSIADYTYEELLQIPIIHAATGKQDLIVKLDDFFEEFTKDGIWYAIELKDPDIEKDVFDMVKKYGLEKQTIITSFSLDYLVKLKSIYPQASVGYLTADFDDDMLVQMKEIGVEQLCPNGANLTPEKVEKWHEQGFNVRAWGINDEHLMRRSYDCGVDGMTVNFPDKLISYIKEKR